MLINRMSVVQQKDIQFLNSQNKFINTDQMYIRKYYNVYTLTINRHNIEKMAKINNFKQRLS
ncbi:hypothetical protein pb186bvf_012384 [Paramecium bursaria]